MKPTREIFEEYSDNFQEFIHDFAKFDVGDEILVKSFTDGKMYGTVTSVCFDPKTEKFCYNVSGDRGWTFLFMEEEEMEKV